MLVRVQQVLPQGLHQPPAHPGLVHPRRSAVSSFVFLRDPVFPTVVARVQHLEQTLWENPLTI